MRKSTLGIALLSLGLLAACDSGPTTGTDTAFGRLSTLTPGSQAAITQKLKVNVVSIGFRPTAAGQVADPRELNFDAMRAELPSTYVTRNRYPNFYGNVELTGNNFEFDYNYVPANTTFEDEFFKFLVDNGSEKGRTTASGIPLVNLGAAYYNCQDPSLVGNAGRPAGEATPIYGCTAPATNIARLVTGNYEIDGAKVEQWLNDNLSRLGVDTTEHTVVLINWYSRPDFKFHSYSHLREETKETDTGANFGARSSRRTIAWGGTKSADQASAKRLWFIDPSANPDYWTSSWNMTDSDVDGDGVYDKRLPPIWEYGTRKASMAYGEKISNDMAKVIRYVAIDLLFTPSPLYRAALTPPDMPEKMNVDLAVEQGATAVDPATVIQPQLAQDRISVLNPFVTWSNSLRTTPLTGDLAKAYACQFPATVDDTCSPDYADPNSELFYQQALAEVRTRAQQTPDTYNVPNYLFNDGDTQAVNRGLLGRAYSDGVTGTQSFIGNYLTPGLYSAGYGFTDTVVHESGHHMSQSHPHDGYDSERDEDFGPSAGTLFVDVGDESSSVMSYNNLAKTFGQFNLDAQYRYLTTAYITNTNAILSLTQGAGKVSETKDAVQSADQKFTQAVNAYQARNYYGAAQLAHDGYVAVLNAAKGAGVSVQGYKWYERVDQLSVKKAPNYVNHYRPIVGQGAVMRPEETPFLRSKRLAP